MKYLWKHLLCATLCLCLLFSSALAEGVDINLYVMTDYSDANALTVRSGQVVGQNLYLLVGGPYGDMEEGQVRLERWTSGMSEPEIVLEGLLSYRNENADDTMPVINRLLSDVECLYGYDEINRQIMRLVDGAGNAAVEKLSVLEAAEEEKSEDGFYYSSYISAMFVQNGEVVRLAENYGEGESSMVVERYALDTGKLIARSGADNTLRTLCAYKDGKYLALVQPTPGPEDMEAPMSQIAVYDPATGEMTSTATLSGSYLSNLTYDAESDTAYYCSGATIYAVPLATGESRVSAYLPVNAWSGSDTTFATLSGGMIAYANGDGAYVRRLDAPELAAGALTVANEGGTIKYMAVVGEHPELNVTLASEYPQTMEELTTAMVSGTGTMDVLSLTTTYNPVARLIDKGYAADLSGYPELMAVVQRMDTRFTDSVMRDGKLYALPVSLSTNTLGVNAQTMEKLGLTESDLPTTWLEFLDFAANFYYDYGEENADVALMDLNMRKPLFQMIRDQYVAVQLRDTGSVSFDTPLFRKLMQALEAIDFTELDPYEVKGDKVWEGDDANEFYEKQQLFTLYSEANPCSMGQSGYGRVNQPLVLSLDGETEPIIPTGMTVMIVNPRSTRLDQAAAYLTAYAGHYEAESENIMFFPDQNEPVPNSYYEVQKQSYEDRLNDLDGLIEKTDESEKPALREEREQVQSYLDELETQRMSVTEEMIQAYREQVAPYLYVTPQTPLTNPDSSAELDTLTRQYLDRAIDLDTYIREMDQRVRMMMLEDM